MRTRTTYVLIPAIALSLTLAATAAAQFDEACCFPDGSCTEMKPDDCINAGGQPQGAGTDCGNVDCPAGEVACCLPSGFCVYTTTSQCFASGGYVPPGGLCLGDGNSNGIDDACEDLDLEPCCLTDGTCQLVPIGDCAFLGFPPPGGVCLGDGDGNGVDDACEQQQTIACCLPDGSCAIMGPFACWAAGGFPTPGGICLGDANANGIDDACEVPTDDGYALEFSVDIGSDRELSDPFMDGDEGFDPGDVYWWKSLSVDPPGRDGFKDDFFIFSSDPFPDAPDAALATAVPVGSGSIQDYYEYFDLDGHDQIDLDLYELQWIPPDQLSTPIPGISSPCIHTPDHLLISFDDDQAPGWPAGNVPVTAPSPAGGLYGMTAAADEVIGVDLLGPIPYVIGSVYPFANEKDVHDSLEPNPDAGEEEDDDVDSLDIVRSTYACPVWYFSPDHEANLTLDPGGIYQVTPFGPVQIIDEAIHLGLAESTDIDAFEFVNIPNPDGTAAAFGIVFSVDDDDPLTAVDESGGLSPGVVYGSLFLGTSFPISQDDFGDDIDAITAWIESLEPQIPTGACCTAGVCSITDFASCVAGGGYYKGDFTVCGPGACICRGDANCDGVIDFGDINAFVDALLNGNYCDGTGENADVNGNGSVGFDDINPFVNLLTTNPLPIICP